MSSSSLVDNDIEFLCKHLDLQPHPEGGFFRELYRSPLHVAECQIEALTSPVTPEVQRSLVSSIYYLLPEGCRSAFHRISFDELLYFHGGGPVRVVEIDTDTFSHRSIILGSNIINGELPQYVVRAGTIFAFATVPGGKYSLFGCVVSPGFEFRDMQMFTVREMRDLCSAFPPSEELKHDIETLSLPDLEDSTSISPK